MKTLRKLSFLVLLLTLILTCKNKDVKETDRMEWWRDARFGLFLHWGLYAVPAGEWNGKTNHEVWIRESAQIPLEQYEKFTTQFNPVKFNADEWVKLARDAGMKYIVITSKHHDGFCMFDSKETNFDIISTPFRRDILKEMSVACAKQGIKLCFYYSIMDWHHPDYLPRRKWESDRPDAGADFEKYISYMKNQLTELLTNYSKIGVLWFDGEWESTWTHQHGKNLYEYLRKIQPDLIINNRVDKGRRDNAGMTADSSFCGDFGTPEQEIPPKGLPGVDWESCITMNGTWGYNKNAQDWKSSQNLVRNLIDIASKGGNFLLNIGPTSEGVFPDSSITRLKDIGSWMRVNGEAIYKTEASPFEKLEWGRCTQRVSGNETILYLHLFEWPRNGNLVVSGLTNHIIRAYALSDPSKKELPFEKAGTNLSINLDNLTQSKYATVVVLEIEGKPTLELTSKALSVNR